MKSLKYTLPIFLIILVMINFNAIGQTTKKESSGAGGQSGYKTGIGLRGGLGSGITIKHFIQEGKAIEGILTGGFNYRGTRITGLYEVHKPFPDAAGLDWFYGVGAHIGTFSSGYYGYYYGNNGYYDKHGNWHAGSYQNRYIYAGIDAIIGLEYQFEEIPFTVTLDLKPYFDFFNGRGSYVDAAFSLRYYFR